MMLTPTKRNLRGPKIVFILRHSESIMLVHVFGGSRARTATDFTSSSALMYPSFRYLALYIFPMLDLASKRPFDVSSWTLSSFPAKSPPLQYPSGTICRMSIDRPKLTQEVYRTRCEFQTSCSKGGVHSPCLS